MATVDRRGDDRDRESQVRRSDEERVTRTEEQNRERRYLAGVLDRIKERCELLGIDAPKLFWCSPGPFGVSQ